MDGSDGCFVPNSTTPQGNQSVARSQIPRPFSVVSVDAGNAHHPPASTLDQLGRREHLGASLYPLVNDEHPRAGCGPIRAQLEAFVSAV